MPTARLLPDGRYRIRLSGGDPVYQLEKRFYASERDTERAYSSPASPSPPPVTRATSLRIAFRYRDSIDAVPVDSIAEKSTWCFRNRGFRPIFSVSLFLLLSVLSFVRSSAEKHLSLSSRRDATPNFRKQRRSISQYTVKIPACTYYDSLTNLILEK